MLHIELALDNQSVEDLCKEVDVESSANELFKRIQWKIKLIDNRYVLYAKSLRHE